jgi:hypothetical protein
MPVTPEQRAREAIDALLAAAGWVIQDIVDFNRNAGEGVAVREFVLPNGPCDYLLFVGGKAAGVVEAKITGHTLSGVAEQSAKYILDRPQPVHLVLVEIAAGLHIGGLPKLADGWESAVATVSELATKALAMRQSIPQRSICRHARAPGQHRRTCLGTVGPSCRS